MSAATPSWRFAAQGLLADPAAPRVFDPGELGRWLGTHGFDPAPRTLGKLLGEWEAAGVIRWVSRGLYLNLRATPLPQVEEAAHRRRRGAIVSLATVLGRAGVLNNPTHWVTAVVPSATVVGAMDLESESGSVFRFAQMRPDLLPKPGTAFAADALAPYAPVPTATPEKALLDWLYLAASPRGSARWLLPPVHDWDIESLDGRRLLRLARRMDLVEELARFRAGLAGPGPRVSLRRPRT